MREAGVAAGDAVVDVGAGTGSLTRALADAGARVVALELDPALAAELRRRFAGRPQVVVVEQDVLAWRWPAAPFDVVANLPFARSGEILGSLLRADVALRRAHVIVQWELAARHAATWPATLRGVYWRAWYDLAVVGRLAAGAFAPPPSVCAAVLRAARRPQPLVPAEDARAYRAFLAAAFRTNAPLRRALASRLSPLETKRAAAVLGFDPDALPRDLDARQWAGLFRRARRSRG